ncbi:MAG: DNA repair protein RadA [Bacteroidales bacterium]|nr:DNA repair protein RadA [Bacteroidales bacterium]
MAKRAYSPKEIAQKQWVCLPWDSKWSGPFGEPTINDTWFVCGPSASGKSSFVMQLAKELCNYGHVLYVSYEEGVNLSFQERMERFRMSDVQGRFRVVTEDTLEELTERLSKKRSANFVIIDSFQYAGWSYEETKALVDRFKHKSFIFISQEYKGQPMGKSAMRVKYMAGIKVRVAGYKAYCQGRFTGDPGSYYTVWEEGVIRTSNNL